MINFLQRVGSWIIKDWMPTCFLFMIVFGLYDHLAIFSPTFLDLFPKAFIFSGALHVPGIITVEIAILISRKWDMVFRELLVYAIPTYFLLMGMYYLLILKPLYL